MHRHLRTGLAIAVAVSLTAGGPVVGAAALASNAEPHVEVLRLSPSSASATAFGGTLPALSAQAAARSPAPCSDSAYTLLGSRWRQTYKWSLRIGSTPPGLNRGAVETAIKKGVNNIVKANNDCGRADKVKATASYLGRTTAKPNCGRRDGRNVVGFKALPADVAARACWWTNGNSYIEADVQFNSSLAWTTSLAGCVNRLMIEAVMTHEAGHVFGLGHVGEKRHGRLTMSTYIDGVCQNQESTLGLGDMLGLEKLYP